MLRALLCVLILLFFLPKLYGHYGKYYLFSVVLVSSHVLSLLL